MKKKRNSNEDKEVGLKRIKDENEHFQNEENENGSWGLYKLNIKNMVESMKSIKKSLEEIRYYSTQIKTIHDSNFEKSNKLITDTHTNMKNSINKLKIGRSDLDKLKRKLLQNSNPQYKLPN